LAWCQSKDKIPRRFDVTTSLPTTEMRRDAPLNFALSLKCIQTIRKVEVTRDLKSPLRMVLPSNEYK